MTRAAQLDRFLGWLAGTDSQQDVGTSARTFRRTHAWCWNVDPRIAVTGEIYDEIQLDGIYVTGGWCALIAIADGKVIGWQWCDYEKSAAWIALIEAFPPPRVVVIDGGSGLASALKQVWPDTAVQRCLVHVQRNVRSYLTTRPRTDAGKTLWALARTLTRIRTREQGAHWEVKLHDWHQVYGHLTRAKTYANATVVRPAWAPSTSAWWWTHDRLRKAYRLLERLVRQGVLFTYLGEDLQPYGISSTTNMIEGGINAQLRELLHRHRGMPTDHARRAIEWWCYLHSPRPAPPSSLIRPEHHKPAPTAIAIHDDPTPGDYGTTATAEEGLWARKGWAGRSN